VLGTATSRKTFSPTTYAPPTGIGKRRVDMGTPVRSNTVRTHLVASMVRHQRSGGVTCHAHLHHFVHFASIGSYTPVIRRTPESPEERRVESAKSKHLVER
jgi:hypothetical protein